MEVVSQEYMVYKLKQWHPEWLPSFFSTLSAPWARSKTAAIYKKERGKVLQLILGGSSSKAQSK
jgi:hypothetical protein